MTETQYLLLIAIATVALTWIMIWGVKDRDSFSSTTSSQPSSGTQSQKERYSTRNYTNTNDWTADRPYPMYVSHLDNEGDYKYIDEYVQALDGNPFRNFPPTDNYTTRLMSYLRAAST